jgi:antitoxin ParD1/3/4
VKSGRYQNASEVMREGLRMIEQREKRKAAKLEALRKATRVGFADLDEGRFLDFSSFDDLEDHLTRTTKEALASRHR